MRINAHRAGFVLGVLMVVQYGELRGTAQGMPSVRVIPAEAKVFVRPDVISDVVTVARAGAVLDLMDKREGWYWILLGRDENGSRQPGWIQADQVAIATGPAFRDSLRTLHEELAALPEPAGPPPIDSRKAERQQARKAAGEARAAARLERAARNDFRKAEREQARNAAGEARAVARIEAAARNDFRKAEREQARKGAGEGRAVALIEIAARNDSRKAEREQARKAAEEARAAARLEAAARNDSRKAEREQARKAAEEARAAARIEAAARNVDEARRKYEGVTKKPE